MSARIFYSTIFKRWEQINHIPSSRDLDTPMLIRLWADDVEEIRPLIAKGNIFEGQEARA